MIAICLFVIAISSISASAFDMRADEAQFDTKRKVYHLAGNVTAKLNGKTFIADKIVIYMNGVTSPKRMNINESLTREIYS